MLIYKYDVDGKMSSVSFPPILLIYLASIVLRLTFEKEHAYGEYFQHKLITRTYSALARLWSAVPRAAPVSSSLSPANIGQLYD